MKMSGSAGREVKAGEKEDKMEHKERAHSVSISCGRNPASFWFQNQKDTQLIEC